MESSEHSQLSDYPSDVEDEPGNVTDEDEQAGVDAPLPQTFDLDPEESEGVSQPPAARQGMFQKLSFDGSCRLIYLKWRKETRTRKSP